MNFIVRHAGLVLAAVLALGLAAALHRAGSRPIPAAPLVPAFAPPQPAAQIVEPKKRVRRKLAAKRAEPPAAPAPVRGARLREKGEALGGGTPDRVDKATDTRTTP